MSEAASNSVRYHSCMREEVLRRYFESEVPASVLADDVQGSVTHLDDVRETIAIEDMQVSFDVNRLHVVMLCDAFLERAIDGESLTTLAFGLVASDHFVWDDEVISEVLFDWSAPEINFPLNDKTIRMHRSWLADSVQPVPRRSHVSPGSTRSRLVSERTKVAPSRRKSFW